MKYTAEEDSVNSAWIFLETKAVSWVTGVWFTVGQDFSLHQHVQTGSGAHPASYPMCTGGPFPGGKAWPGRDADHLPPSSAGVKN
jgi:hypothetical protein